MISDLRLAQIIAVITELSEQKKQDLYRFLIDLREKTDSIPDDQALAEIRQTLEILATRISNKVDKIAGKGLSTNDFTDALREKLLIIKGNVQPNWNEEDETSGAYIRNKPNLDNVGAQSDWNENDNESAAYIKNKPNLGSYEVKSNKVTSISDQSTDEQYPTAKCMYDMIGDIESTLDAILGE